MTGGPRGPLSNDSLKLIIGHSIQRPIRSNYIARAKTEAKRGSYTCNNVLNIILQHKEEAPSHTGPSQVHRSHFKIWNNVAQLHRLHSRVTTTTLIDVVPQQLHFIFTQNIYKQMFSVNSFNLIHVALAQTYFTKGYNFHFIQK